MRIALMATLLAFGTLAGCLSDDGGNGTGLTGTTAELDHQLLDGFVNLTALALPGNFTESHVDVAVGYGGSLYEPTMDVCDDGSIYITGHTLLVDTTGAPVFGSYDDGETWEQLPFLGPVTMPADLPGATPPPTDEIFLSCGEDGWLYGVDITLATFPVNAWSGSGTSLAYHNPNAYDEQQVALQAGDCLAAPAKDRPWGAYSDGSLLMVSNPAAGPVQIGILDVPSGPLGLVPAPVGLGATTGGGHWNVCAGTGYHTADCRIPGIPDMHTDGTFAVPQRCDDGLYLVTGNKRNIMTVDVQQVFPHTSGGEITSVYGQAAFDATGTLFVGITNNTAFDDDETRDGFLRFAASRDGGDTWEHARFATGTDLPAVHFYMDANKFGIGSLVFWAIPGDGRNELGNPTTWDWYMGHLYLTDDGLTMKHTTLVIDEGLQPSADVTGAALGPDGRAYTAMYDGAQDAPLSVFIQNDGHVMPVFGDA